MALFSVIQQNTGTEMVRFLHLGTKTCIWEQNIAFCDKMRYD